MRVRVVLPEGSFGRWLFRTPCLYNLTPRRPRLHRVRHRIIFALTATAGDPTLCFELTKLLVEIRLRPAPAVVLHPRHPLGAGGLVPKRQPEDRFHSGEVIILLRRLIDRRHSPTDYSEVLFRAVRSLNGDLL